MITRADTPLAGPLVNGQHEAKKAVNRYVLMNRVVDLMIEKTKLHEFWPELYPRASQVLSILPLSKPEYVVASSRLKNALQYAMACEYGAATLELRMLRGQLNALAS